MKNRQLVALALVAVATYPRGAFGATVDTIHLAPSAPTTSFLAGVASCSSLSGPCARSDWDQIVRLRRLPVQNQIGLIDAVAGHPVAATSVAVDDEFWLSDAGRLIFGGLGMLVWGGVASYRRARRTQYRLLALAADRRN